MNDQAIVKATILTIGDELLIGQTIDTNSAWMATELNGIGIPVIQRVAVGDNWDDIWKGLDDLSLISKIILITGGLGPTSDDITKPLLCQYFGGKMVTNEAALENVREIFIKKLNRPLIERNIKQAEVPDVCNVIQNKRGTAPGMWFEKNGCIFVSMPGVPHEMKGMMTDYVLPELQNRFNLSPVQHRTLLTAGVGESFLAELLVQFEQQLDSKIKLAYLPNYGMVKLRLSSSTAHSDDMKTSFENLQSIVKEYMVADYDATLQEVVFKYLVSNKKTLAIAESCTGGQISALLTSLPGSSSVYLGGIVAYSNELKQNLLNVPESILAEYGAVSEPTVQKMAEGIRELTGSDFALATSGIMGPGGEHQKKRLDLYAWPFQVQVARSPPTFNSDLTVNGT